MADSVDRGVSDAVGFVLIFGLIITSVGIIYATGFGNIDNARQLEERGNVERAYDILGDNIHEVARGEAPSRSTQVQLGSNEIVSADPVEFTVTVGGTELETRESFPIEYIISSSGDRVLYVNGATIRDPKNQRATMIREPDIQTHYNSSDNLQSIVFPVIRTQPVESGLVGISGGNVDIRTTSIGRETEAFDSSGAVPMEFEVVTPRAEMWEAYCTDSQTFSVKSSDTDISNNTVTCELADGDAENVYIQYQYIDVELAS